jgi:ABC-2 type transport system permease protein
VSRLASYIRKTLVVVEIDVRKLVRDPIELFTRAVQPFLWLVVFGQVFGRLRNLPGVGDDYSEFIAPGALAQGVLFIAIFYGISIIWERDLGIVHKFLVSPTPRSALVLGKALSAGVRGLSQMVIVYIIAAFLGVRINWNPLALIGVALAVMLGAGIFATLSFIIACLVKNRERFMGIGQLLAMPLFFASNAIYPLSLMPLPIRILSQVNPLTYQVDAIRGLMLAESSMHFSLLLNYAVLLTVLVALVALGARLFPRVIV